MTFEVVANPADERAYLAGLKRCFAGAWDEQSYRWFLARPFRGRAPDVFGVYSGKELVAGLGVNYREVSLPDGRSKLVGVLTAAWTLPEHRGRWHLHRLIEAIKNLTTDRGCAVLLSFVTLDNASAIVLSRLRAVPLPSFYLLGSEPFAELAGVAPEPRTAALCASDVANAAAGAIHFSYDWPDWRQQHLERPYATVSLAVDQSLAVLEETEATDRLQWFGGPNDAAPRVLDALLARCRERGRKLFHYTMSPTLAGAARERGLEVRPGAMMVLDLDGDDWWRARWHVHGGDRM